MIGYVDQEPRYDSRHIVGTHEIAEMLGVTRQRAGQLAREKGFPAPYGILRCGKVWKRPAVEAWARKNGRTLTGGKPAPGPS